MNKPATDSQSSAPSASRPAAAVAGQSAEEIRAFAALDRARNELTQTEATVRIHRNALRRWARQHGYRLRAARCEQHQADTLAAIARCNAENAYRKALRVFRSSAMLAALTRVVETDRRLNAA